MVRQIRSKKRSVSRKSRKLRKSRKSQSNKRVRVSRKSRIRKSKRVMKGGDDNDKYIIPDIITNIKKIYKVNEYSQRIYEMIDVNDLIQNRSKYSMDTKNPKPIIDDVVSYITPIVKQMNEQQQQITFDGLINKLKEKCGNYCDNQ